MKLLFLDIDGVLNGHSKLPGSMYCGIVYHCMEKLNRVIRDTECKLILSSAWRYQILCGATTLRGFEFMLFTHGLVAPMGTLIGHTPPDEVIPDRGEQVRAALYSFLPLNVEAWAVVDDDPMQMKLGPAADRLVRTDPINGLSWSDADRLIELLNGGAK